MSSTHELPNGAPTSRVLLDEFLETVPDSIYFKDRESRFIAVSRSKAVRHGVSDRHQLVGLTDFDLFAREHAARARAEELEILRTGQPMLNKLHRLIWPDGRQGWGLSSKLPLRNERGEIVGTFGVTRDVTELKRIEQDLEKSQRALLEASHLAGMAEVATGVLHNVGNALTSLNVSIETMRQEVSAHSLARLPQVVALLRSNVANLTQFLTDDPKGKLVLDYLDALASREAEHQKRLLDELGTMAKHISHIDEIVATQQSYATTVAITEELSPADVWEDAVRLNAAALSRHSVKVVREFAECPKMVVQKGKLLQILVNLLQNAKNACSDAHSPTSKTVTLRLVPTDTGVRFSIADNGVGIAAEHLPRVFQQGFTTRKTGHGFGLHSCAVMAQQMGGMLTATSAGHMMGAAFMLELPLKPPEDQPTLQVPVAPDLAAQVVPEARFTAPAP